MASGSAGKRHLSCAPRARRLPIRPRTLIPWLLAGGCTAVAVAGMLSFDRVARRVYGHFQPRLERQLGAALGHPLQLGPYQGLGWSGLQLAALHCRRRGDGAGWQAIRRSLSSGRFPDEGMGLLERHDPQGMALRWLRQDPANADEWIRHPAAPGLWQRPLLLLGGWHDPHLEGVLDLWRLARAAGGEPLLRIGAWSHLNWREGADQLQLAFFRRHLQREDGGTGEGEPAPMAAVEVQAERTGLWHSLGLTARACSTLRLVAGVCRSRDLLLG
ncbi:MAG: CocE/NonD family hydrolase, partial [Cyanobium sp.]